MFIFNEFIRDKKALENCNQVKASLLTKKLLEVKYKVLTKRST